jgi:mono/diheme cytochrome c family protein
MLSSKPVFLLMTLSVMSLLMITCTREIPGKNNESNGESNGNENGSGTGTGTGTGTGSGNGSTAQSTTCSADSVYFVNTILPLINSSCAMSGCHDAQSHKEGVDLSSYSKIRNYVSPFNASSSKLYTVVVKTGSGRMPPAPMPSMTSANVALLKKWINQGALNVQCNNGGCDTTMATYAATVAATMSSNCTGCHNTASPGGGIDLSTYAGVRAQALNGRLIGSMAFAAGYSAMPKGGNKLADCQITQVQKWIQAGALNN